MSTRFRCAGCGNRTRFDVVSSRRTRAFWHFTLGGERSIDEEEVLADVVESVMCRWCGKTSSIEVIEDEAVPEGFGAEPAPHETAAPV
ncbi:MAG: hypothetical protein ABSA31_04380 [Acidimicrobiales bacterium]